MAIGDVEIIYNLFHCRRDVYAVKWTGKGRSGFSPVCARRMKEGCPRVKSPKSKCRDCTMFEGVVFTEQILARHLNGGYTVGVYPLLANNTTWFTAVDFDRDKTGTKPDQDPYKDAKAFLEVCNNNGISAYIERSQSGKGFHVWVFFSAPIPAWKSRAVCFALLEEAAVIELGDNSSFDRIFPNQSELSGKGFGNLIALPYQGPQKVKAGNSVFLNPETMEPWPNQELFLKGVVRISEAEFDTLIEEWELKKPEERTEKRAAAPAAPRGDAREGEVKTLSYKGVDKLPERCEFVRFCKENQVELPEPLWHSLATVLAKFENGRERFHEYSCQHPKYSLSDADAKFDVALSGILNRVGPHTCETIRDRGFTGCPASGCSVKSPVGVVFNYYQYWVKDGGYWMRKKAGKEFFNYKLSNFVIDIERDVYIDDGHDKMRTFEGSLRLEGNKREFEIDAKDFFNDSKLKEVVGFSAGVKASFLPEDIKHIRLAAQQEAKAEEKTVYRKFGWTESGEFLSPDVIVSRGGMRSNVGGNCSLEGIQGAEKLNLKMIDDATFKRVGKHIFNDLLELGAFSVTYPAIGHVFLAPIMPFFHADPTRYALWLQGRSGTGKSFLATMCQCFFGDFGGVNSLVSWSSTPNSIQRIGSFFNSSLFVVDDFKKSQTQKHYPQFVGMLQAYADVVGRSRLNADATTQKTRAIMGLMMSSGEDLPEYEASLLARLLIVDMNRQEINPRAGGECKANLKDYPGVMARYIHWLAGKNMRKHAEGGLDKHIAFFHTGIETKLNSIRIARNLALNYIGFLSFIRFMEHFGVISKADAELRKTGGLEVLMKLRETQLAAVKEEQASSVFIDTLRDLIATNRLGIHHEGSVHVYSPIQREIGVEEVQNFVGFIKHKEPYVYINPTIAYGAVNRALIDGGNALKFSKKAIAQQLECDGFIVVAAGKNTTQTVRYCGVLRRCWVFTKISLGVEDEY